MHVALGNAFLVCQNNICFKRTGKNLGLTKYAAVGAEQTHAHVQLWCLSQSLVYAPFMLGCMDQPTHYYQE